MKLDKSYILCIGQKEMTKKVHKNIMNSIRYNKKTNTIFMNSENSKTSDTNSRLLLKLTDKTDSRTKGKYIALWNLSIY